MSKIKLKTGERKTTVSREKIAKAVSEILAENTRENFMDEKDKSAKETIKRVGLPEGFRSVSDNLKYNGFEKDQMVEVTEINDGVAGQPPLRTYNVYSIGSIGIDDNRCYALLNRVTVIGNVDKRYKPIKKYFDELNISKINKFNKGDIVYLNKRGAISWEPADYTRTIKKNMFFTVRGVRYDEGVCYVELHEVASLIHPNHYAKKEEII
jgi:hypothetical protein